VLKLILGFALPGYREQGTLQATSACGRGPCRTFLPAWWWYTGVPGTAGDGLGVLLGFGVKRSIFRAAVLTSAALLSCPSTAQDGAARIYVRRIEFTGVLHTNDSVLRRELLLFEGGYLNTVALDRSVQRLEALPFVDDATPRLRDVPGAMDVVDVVIEIVEAPARRYGGGGGYSEAFRTSLHGYFVNENLFGLGQRLGLGVERDDVSSSAELSHTQPYATTDGVSRTIELSSRRIDRLTRDASALAGDFSVASLEYGYRLESGADSAAFEPLRRGACRPPIGLGLRLPDLADCSRESTVRLGVELRSAELTASGAASAQLADWISTNGSSSVSNGTISTSLDEIDFVLGWRRDSRDRPVLGDDGSSSRSRYVPRYPEATSSTTGRITRSSSAYDSASVGPCGCAAGSATVPRTAATRRACLPTSIGSPAARVPFAATATTGSARATASATRMAAIRCSRDRSR
jgi:hypothetical protein